MRYKSAPIPVMHDCLDPRRRRPVWRGATHYAPKRRDTCVCTLARFTVLLSREK